MTAELVTYTVDGRVGIMTINRPDKLNAISLELKRLLVERFHEADRAAIAEIDLNPITVLERGQGCVVVDALIVPRKRDAVDPAPARLRSQP